MKHCNRKMNLLKNESDSLPFTVRCPSCGTWWDVSHKWAVNNKRNCNVMLNAEYYLTRRG